MGYEITSSGIVAIASQFGFVQLEQKNKCFYEGKTYRILSFIITGNQKVLDCILVSPYLVLSGAVRTINTPFDESMIDALSPVDSENLHEQIANLSKKWQNMDTVLFGPLSEKERTEAETIIKARRGQDLYRERLMKLWNGRCALTGVGISELLVGSHAKAWEYSNNKERLDPYNGFLFEARIDKLFDKHLITFDDSGIIIFSKLLTPNEINILCLEKGMRINAIDPRHIPYLTFHRDMFYSKEQKR